MKEMAAHTGRVVRPRRRRALQARRAARSLLVGRHDVHRGRARRTRSSPRAAAGSSTATRRGRRGRWSRAGNGTRVEVTTESEPALPTDKFMEAVTGRRGWMKRNLAQGAAAACSRSSRRAWIAGRASPWVACNLRRRMRRLVLIAAARRRLRRLRRRGLHPRGRDRGHLRRRRQPRLPGPAVALPEPGGHRGPRVPDGPADRHEPAASRRRDRGSACGCGSRTTRTRR